MVNIVALQPADNVRVYVVTGGSTTVLIMSQTFIMRLCVLRCSPYRLFMIYSDVLVSRNCETGIVNK